MSICKTGLVTVMTDFVKSKYVLAFWIFRFFLLLILEKGWYPSKFYGQAWNLREILVKGKVDLAYFSVIFSDKFFVFQIQKYTKIPILNLGTLFFENIQNFTRF